MIKAGSPYWMEGRLKIKKKKGLKLSFQFKKPELSIIFQDSSLSRQRCPNPASSTAE